MSLHLLPVIVIVKNTSPPLDVLHDAADLDGGKDVEHPHTCHGMGASRPAAPFNSAIFPFSSLPLPFLQHPRLIGLLFNIYSAENSERVAPTLRIRSEGCIAAGPRCQ